VDQETDTPVLVARSGHVLVITLNRPQARNAVNRTTHLAVGLALETAEHDPGIRAVILTGAGDLAFCAGADLKAVARGEALQPDDPVQQGWGFAGYCSHPISKPTIAAVNGLAVGGGTELVLASDLAVAVETASFGLPEVKRGIFAGGGGAFRLPEQVPRKVAMEILLTGEPLSARRALEIGLINAVVPAGQALEAALRLAERVCANAPLAVQVSKRLALGMVDGAIAREAPCWAQSKAESRMLMRSEDAREGPRAFAEKRTPRWLGR
jgi:crotonobetainyl-CoA hydratase